MSIHKDCGEEIRWGKREDDDTRFRPPLEFAGMGYIIDADGVAIYVSIYRDHICDPDTVRAWMDHRRALAAAKGEALDEIEDDEARIAARERDRQDQLILAATVECDTCEEPAGYGCINLSLWKRKQVREETRFPHASRLVKAQKAIREQERE